MSDSQSTSQNTPQNISDDQFEQEVLRSDLPVVVDFWAPWCAPCKQIAPFLEELAKEKAGTLKVVKVNVDDSPKTSTTYNLRGIPTLMLFRGGEMIATKVGAVPKSVLDEWVSSSLATAG
ncbi:MAG: thioredoxin [Alphaproteobacteria bacterium GM202ARS2]|nr:thioredoxin [Alphaproteobacteria bacterium GM202ARS2]